MQGRWILLAGAGIFAVSGFVFAWALTNAGPRFSTEGPPIPPGDDARGAVVFNASDCASCHARPGQPDRLALGGGLALASPFGTFRAPNISPDPVDGIGAWSVTDLANALIAGVSPGQQHYYPAFPYPSYTGMTLQDMADLFAYLRTLPPVSGRAPPHDLPLVFRYRRMIGVWKWLFFREGGSVAIVSEEPVRDRGAYLAEVLGHCADCHSTRNVLGAVKPETRFAGGPDPEGTGFVPNITPQGIGDWTEADIVKALTTGETPSHGRLGSSMADVVANTALLPERDRRAIARYIKSLPPRPTPKP